MRRILHAAEYPQGPLLPPDIPPDDESVACAPFRPHNPLNPSCDPLQVAEIPAAADCGDREEQLRAYLSAQENPYSEIDRLMTILAKDHVILEIGCGSCETALQIALANPDWGVVATDKFDWTEPLDGCSYYRRIAEDFRLRRLPVQACTPDNLVKTRAKKYSGKDFLTNSHNIRELKSIDGWSGLNVFRSFVDISAHADISTFLRNDGSGYLFFDAYTQFLHSRPFAGKVGSNSQQRLSSSIGFRLDFCHLAALKSDKVIVSRNGTVDPLFNDFIYKVDQVDINRVAAFLLDHKHAIADIHEIAPTAKAAAGTCRCRCSKNKQPYGQNHDLQCLHRSSPVIFSLQIINFK